MNLVNQSLVFVDVDVNSANEVIQFLSRKLLVAGFVKETFEMAVLKREDEFPTGLPTPEFGVAIPHTDPEHVINPTIAVAVLKNPVAFKEMGYPESIVSVKLVCLLALGGKGQVELLSRIVEAIQDGSFLTRICTEKSSLKIAELFNSKLLISEEKETR